MVKLKKSGKFLAKGVKEFWKQASPSEKVELVAGALTAPVSPPIAGALGVGYLVESGIREQMRRIKAEKRVKELEKKLRKVR